jgi:hypothetical protein
MANDFWIMVGIGIMIDIYGLWLVIWTGHNWPWPLFIVIHCMQVEMEFMRDAS